jgi:glycosyltransferase involved in cell wall biosynthesis
MVSSATGATRLLLDRTNFAFRSLQYLRRHDPDVIHVHLPFAANVIATLSDSMANRMVYTAHIGETEKRITNPRFSPDAYLARRASRTIALNPKTEEAFADRGVDEDRLEVIPNGVDVSRFDEVDSEIRAEAREKYGLDDGPLVLFVGTITPRKGVVDLVEAASAVTDGHGDAQFVLVGEKQLEPDYTEQVTEAIEGAGISDRVTLTGFVSEQHLLAFYDMADLFVLPSYEEGSSIAVTEALAAGLPVVGSEIDGIVQQIEHGVHGLLTPPGDTETLASHISRLLDDTEMRTETRTAVQERAHRLSWNRITDRVIDVYEEVNAKLLHDSESARPVGLYDWLPSFRSK